MIAPTLHEIFEEWKKNGLDRESTWTQHWENVWRLHISQYVANGWHLIPIAPNSKRPMERTHWDADMPLDKERAMSFVRSGCNIAVVAKYSRLVIAECDADLPAAFPREALNLTLTARTPRGYAFFLKNMKGNSAKKKRKAWEKLRLRWGFDTLRDDVQYQLVPLSRTCTMDQKGGCDHPDRPHDYRVRTWVSTADTPMAFDRFVEIVT